MHFCGGSLHFDRVASRIACLVVDVCVKFSLLNVVIFVDIPESKSIHPMISGVTRGRGSSSSSSSSRTYRLSWHKLQ